jgi:hypothetical protein
MLLGRRAHPQLPQDSEQSPLPGRFSTADAEQLNRAPGGRQKAAPLPPGLTSNEMPFGARSSGSDADVI